MVAPAHFIRRFQKVVDPFLTVPSDDELTADGSLSNTTTHSERFRYVVGSLGATKLLVDAVVLCAILRVPQIFCAHTQMGLTYVTVLSHDVANVSLEDGRSDVE